MNGVDETTMWKGGIGSVPQAQNSGMPPELEKIIDQIMNAKNSFGGALSGGRKVEALTSIANTVGGLNQTKMREAGETSRLGITEAGAKERLGAIETGLNKRLDITETGLDRRANEKNRMDSPFLKNLLSDKQSVIKPTTPNAPVGGTANPVLTEKYHNKFPDFNSYFK